MPIFNRGDHAGCAAIYISSARRAIDLASDDDAAVLQRGLEEARCSTSHSAKAWALRNAFDEIRQSRTRASTPSRGDRNTSDSCGNRLEAETVMKSVALRAKAAIHVGVPLFNQGDVTGCVCEYTRCCKGIVVQMRAASLDRAGQDVCSDVCSSVERALSSTTAQNSQRDHAWQLRYALDKVIDASGG